MTANETTFTAWLIIDCTDPGCPEAEHRVDLVLVRGFDLAGGPQMWHAMAPPQMEGATICGNVRCETAGEIPGNVCIDWPVRMIATGPILRGAIALRHTLS